MLDDKSTGTVGEASPADVDGRTGVDGVTAGVLAAESTVIIVGALR